MNATQKRTLHREHATINDLANAFRWYGAYAVVNLGRGHSGFGLYVYSQEYPEDGSILIKWRELLSLAFLQREAVAVARAIVRHEEVTYPLWRRPPRREVAVSDTSPEKYQQCLWDFNDCNRARISLKETRAQLAALRERAEKAERERDEVRQWLTVATDGEKRNLDSAIKFNEQRHASEAERDSLKADVTEMAAINASQIESFRSQRDRLEAERATLRQDRDDACIQRDALRAELSEVDDERIHQLGLVAALRAQVERLQSIIDDSLKETP